MAKDKKPKESSQEQKAPDQARHSAKERPRLRSRFEKEVAPALLKELELKNVMAVPRLHKIVVNMGVGEATQNSKVLDPAVNELGQITGQKPVVTRAKKSIAAFKVRQGQSIGAMVTLRGDRMYEFFDRLVNIVLPRVRDFRGVSSKSFDGRGNYTIGLHDQLIFPEISYERVDKQRGMNVTIVTTAANDNQARSLLEAHGHAVPGVVRLQDFEPVSNVSGSTRKFFEDGMTTAKRVKDAKIQATFQKARDNKEPKPKFSTRRHNRCKLCGRPRAFLRKFGICRLCFRGLALRGEIPGVSKSSW